jgi:hypothetical protein
VNGPTYIPAEPGESLTSIADMVARTTGDKAIRSMFRRAIRSDLLLYSTLPCRSADLCKATRLAYGDALQVLSKHSLLSFATCGRIGRESDALHRLSNDESDYVSTYVART